MNYKICEKVGHRIQFLRKDHGFPVNEVYRNSVFKYKGYPIEGMKCCGRVMVKKEKHEGPININAEDEWEWLSLEPGEVRKTPLNLQVEKILVGEISVNEAELTNYFTGTK